MSKSIIKNYDNIFSDAGDSLDNVSVLSDASQSDHEQEQIDEEAYAQYAKEKEGFFKRIVGTLTLKRKKKAQKTVAKDINL
ncbi:Oidioi.mRNA.OKI2018_I69.PAR.g11702.t1.cds [Oikopleura dioica]|uniref:Oidioi.mRNA.OKI2018_I69.PAR.g11702.t1.cds n=1 Tax=Oikopleura dioica TaxID=34765 RepID=A0ABN7S1N9_OIKDI|nr:Oidioi.mRNA.OKI2018_I69.PAR.g11702.t1.cds [Oikopleura dioica]